MTAHEVLCEIDDNRSRGGRCGLVLYVPKRVRYAQEVQQAKAAATVKQAKSTPLTFFALQRHLHDNLFVRVDRVEDFYQPRMPTVEALRRSFVELCDRIDADTDRLLQPVFQQWAMAEVAAQGVVPSSLVSPRCAVPMSVKVIDFLQLKQRPLRQGTELPWQAFLDRLYLAAALREELPLETVRGLIAQLGPQSRGAAEAALAGLSSEDRHHLRHASPAQPSLPEIYLCLRNAVQSPLHAVSSITGRYQVMALDDLIEMDEQAHPNKDDRAAVYRHPIPPQRQILCEYLFALAHSHARMRLRMETYFLGMALFDRFIDQLRARSAVSKEELVLYGCAALLLASKYEEIYSVSLRVLIEGADHQFTAAQLMEAEQRIALCLDFHIATATVSQIATTMLVDQDPPASATQRHLLHYISATLTVRTHFGEYNQALLAATAVFLSRVVCAVPSRQPSEAVVELLPRVSAALQMNATSAKVGRRLYEIFASEEHDRVSTMTFPSFTASNFAL